MDLNCFKMLHVIGYPLRYEKYVNNCAVYDFLMQHQESREKKTTYLNILWLICWLKSTHQGIVWNIQCLRGLRLQAWVLDIPKQLLLWSSKVEVYNGMLWFEIGNSSVFNIMILWYTLLTNNKKKSNFLSVAPHEITFRGFLSIVLFF